MLFLIYSKKGNNNMKASTLLRIGDIIRELRENKGWTQKQLAAESHIHEVQIRRYENNQALPREAQLKKLATALGVTEDYFYKEQEYTFTINIDETEKPILSRPLKIPEFPSKNIAQSLDNLKQSEAEFIRAFAESKIKDNIEVHQLSDLLLYYDQLTSDEKNAFIQILQAYILMNASGKNKLYEYTGDILGNDKYKK